MAKYIFITGGVVSSLGKGMAAATIGALLKARGYKVRIRKLDPYLNIDPGTMSPLQHGEVYVTEDGAETDLDLGHYERFLNVHLRKTDSISGGKIYHNVLNKERRGDYLGATVQMIPNVTDEIKLFLASDITDEDFVICEIGGTVGDIESLVFLEAIRQFANEVGKKRAMFIHLTLLPYLDKSQELKTKPSQHSIKNLLEKGIQADMLMCRSSVPVSKSTRDKLALFCNVLPKNVIPALDVDNIYRLPLAYRAEKIDDRILEHFRLLKSAPKPDMSVWENLQKKIDAPKKDTVIAIVGKYCASTDSYKSLNEALYHAGLALGLRIDVKWIEAEALEKKGVNMRSVFSEVHGILIPGGFGGRGTEGKMAAIRYARENKIPFFGICFGMQLAVIEFCRNVLKIKNAGSTEFTNNCVPIIALMTEWDKNGVKSRRTAKSDMGGTLRLGSYPCRLAEGSKIRKIYGATEISERHRHRYEMDISFEEKLKKQGMLISGRSPDGRLPEIIELTAHPFFIGVQFHPEFKSSPFKSHPLFKAFAEAAGKNAR